MSTLRFGELVKRLGRPEIKSLWTRPERDRAFMRAVKQRRVLTLSQEPNSRHKDFGEIGFQKRPHAAYLIFPKPLAARPGEKIIGIKYDLIGEPGVNDPLSAESLQKISRKPSRKKIPDLKEDALKSFPVRIRRTATVEATISVEAKTKREAEERAIKMAGRRPLDMSSATIKTEKIGRR